MTDLLKILKELQQQKQSYSNQVLELEPSSKYTFGFLLGEYNLKNPLIVRGIEIIKTVRNPKFMKYTSSALNYYLQKEIHASQKHIEKVNNDATYHKKNSTWNSSCSLYYKRLIEIEKNRILKINTILSKKALTDYVDYFSRSAEENNIYDILENWIYDIEFFKEHYGLFKILKALLDFYIFEQSNLKEFKPKETALFNYFSEHNLNLLQDKNYYGYGLITLTTEYEPIFTEHLECRLYNKKLDVTISLIKSMNNTLFKDFLELHKQKIIKTISFRPYDDIPIKGRYTTDMSLESVQFGMIFDTTRLTRLIPTKLISETTYDSLWINPIGNEITFEELKYDFSTFKDYIMTQAVHLEFVCKNGSFYIKHLDHEVIFYTVDEYDKRLSDIKQKGKAQKRQKTFKIDDSEIPFLQNGKPEFLIKVLYTYFSNKKLLNEYFCKCNS